MVSLWCVWEVPLVTLHCVWCVDGEPVMCTGSLVGHIALCVVCRRWACDVYGKSGWSHCNLGSGEAKVAQWDPCGPQCTGDGHEMSAFTADPCYFLIRQRTQSMLQFCCHFSMLLSSMVVWLLSHNAVHLPSELWCCWFAVWDVQKDSSCYAQRLLHTVINMTYVYTHWLTLLAFVLCFF